MSREKNKARILYVALGFLLLAEPKHAVGQALGLLPPGVFAIQAGYRNYDAVSHEYDNSGALKPVGRAFSQEFSGKSALESGKDSDLSKLATELKRYGSADGQADYGEQLYLGRLEAEVSGEITAQLFGVAYGVTKYLSVFVGAPFVDVNVKTDLKIVGANNADAIKSELGELAYDELTEGLDSASSFGVATVSSELSSLGYSVPENWQHSGMGDIRFGTKMGKYLGRAKRFGLGLNITAYVPTGYVEDPSILTDVSVGTGYYSIKNELVCAASVFKRLSASILMGYQYNLSADKKVRVPDQSTTLVASDREENVTYRPGDEVSGALSFSFNMPWVVFGYSNGIERHMGDQYQGNLAGNYELLSQNSDTLRRYHEAALTLDTTEPFKRGRFVYPMLAKLLYKQDLAGRNLSEQDYIEVSFTGFLADPSKGKKNIRRKKRER